MSAGRDEDVQLKIPESCHQPAPDCSPAARHHFPLCHPSLSSHYANDFTSERGSFLQDFHSDSWGGLEYHHEALEHVLGF